jgi:membrane associated rhomboid family serine protease
MVSGPGLLPFPRVAVVVAAVLALLVVRQVAQPKGAWAARLRSRFVLGVPWGTLITALFVLGVYLFVQRGIEGLASPLVIPFRAYSYFYPTGILAAPFSHAGLGHLTGNLLGTLTYGALAEYAWSHYPTERGSQSFSSLRTNPFARILAVPLVAIAAGVLTGAFAWGYIIGFSGVVFALAGFAVVFYPVGTVLVLAFGQVLNLLYTAIQSPTVQQSARTVFTSPWWANIAIQGHALGLFLGVVAAGVLAYRRGYRPDPLQLAFGVLVFATAQNLWAVYWYRGGSTYALFRAAGTILVFGLVVLVVLAMTASERPLISRIDLGRREAAFGLTVAILFALAVPAVPVNLMTVADGGGPTAEGGTVEVRDYRVTYAEDVPNRVVSALDIPLFEQATAVNTSGVIVTSERRHFWQTEVSKGRLAFDNRATVRLGGVGWERAVSVRRVGWTVTGGNATYKVYLTPEGGDRTLSFQSDPATAEPVVAGRNITIRPTEDAFGLVVTRGDEQLDTAPVPERGANVTVGGVTVRERDGDLVAAADGTVVKIASREG